MGLNKTRELVLPDMLPLTFNIYLGEVWTSSTLGRPRDQKPRPETETTNQDQKPFLLHLPWGGLDFIYLGRKYFSLHV
jgi:hypothetical protein